MPVKHAFPSPITDEGDPDEVGPDEWNEDHDLSTFGASEVPIGDAGGYYTGTDVEAATQEAGADLADHETRIGDLESATVRATINFIIDGGGAVVTTGTKGMVVIDFACVIESATVIADQSGSIVVDIWKDTYANAPPDVADTITASAKPTLSSAQKSQDSTLTGWTTSIAAGDVLRFNVDSASTVQRVTVALKVRRT